MPQTLLDEEGSNVILVLERKTSLKKYACLNSTRLESSSLRNLYVALSSVYPINTHSCENEWGLIDPDKGWTTPSLKIFLVGLPPFPYLKGVLLILLYCY